MKRKIHLKSKIFVPDPHMLRIVLGNKNMYEDQYHIIVRCRTACKNTWGYSQILSEYKDSEALPIIYLFFEQSEDLLSIRLGLNYDSSRVYMWPSTIFTIHELIDDISN